MCWFENAYFLKNHKNCFIPMTKTITASILQKKPSEKQSQPASNAPRKSDYSAILALLESRKICNLRKLRSKVFLQNFAGSICKNVTFQCQFCNFRLRSNCKIFEMFACAHYFKAFTYARLRSLVKVASSSVSFSAGWLCFSLGFFWRMDGVILIDWHILLSYSIFTDMKFTFQNQ